MLGNGRCECYCFDGQTRLGHIRGKMRKKVWVSAVGLPSAREGGPRSQVSALCFLVCQGDIVLCGLRDFQDDKVDIIHKYNADEARNLKNYGELPETGTLQPRAAARMSRMDDDCALHRSSHQRNGRRSRYGRRRRQRRHWY